MYLSVRIRCSNRGLLMGIFELRSWKIMEMSWNSAAAEVYEPCDSQYCQFYRMFHFFHFMLNTSIELISGAELMSGAE